MAWAGSSILDQGSRDGAGRPEGDYAVSLGYSQPRKIRPDGLRDIARREMGVVLLRHAGVGMSELGGDDAHRHPVHGQMRAVGVAQDVEVDRGRDASAAAGLIE